VLDVGGSTPIESVYLPAAKLADFLERPVGDASIYSVTTDAAGNVYFYESASDGLIRLDDQGRLSKLTTRTEREAFRDQTGKSGTVNANLLRLQQRTIIDPTAGPITQILYAEQTRQNYVAGVNAYAAGDFDRDGMLSAADINLLKRVLTTRGVEQTDSSHYKFDLNGNAVVDWKDVKILQGFFDLGDGDVNLDGLVDFTDFRILRDDFGRLAQTFIQGDLTGDDQVTWSDVQLWKSSYDTGFRSSLLGLNLTPEPFNAVEWNAFVASVPEPSALAVMACAAVGLLRRRRRRYEPNRHESTRES